jgi:hypothetical protein
MIGKTIFLENEIPYHMLQDLGITKRDVLAMPKDLIEPLLNGRITPLIMTRYKAENGKVVEMPMKLQLFREDDGKVNLMTYQVHKDIERGNLRLNEQAMRKLRDGGVLKREVRDNGIHKQKYVQLDMETNALIIRDSASVRILEKLREMEKIKDIELGTNQKQAVAEGKPVVLSVGDQKVTVGVDLREPLGFKVVNGDMQEWDRQAKIRYDNEHEGFMGYVMTDENRWEYQQVVNRLTRNGDERLSQKKEERKSSGLKL